MKNNVFLLAVVAVFSFGACSTTSSTSSSSTTTSDNGSDAVGAAMGSVFGGTDSSAALNKKVTLPAKVVELFIRKAIAEEEESDFPTTCESLSESPGSGVTVDDEIAAGTYGASSSAVTVTADEDCESLPDSVDAYASFIVASHDMTCVDGDGNSSTVSMTDASGIWRQRTEDEGTTIYGTFSMQVGDATASGIKCSLTITGGGDSGEHSEEEEGEEGHSEEEESEGSSGGTFSGDCEDSSGAAVSQESSLTCTDA